MITNEKGKTILVLTNEFAEFCHYRESLKELTLVTTIVDSSEACLVSSLNNWVIVQVQQITWQVLLIFSTFQSHKAPFHMTVFGGTKFNIMGYGTIKETISITLSPVLSLSKLAFNLNYVRKLTRDLKFYILFFLNHCLFLDFVTHKVIGKGHVIGNLYILDEYKPWLLPA